MNTLTTQGFQRQKPSLYPMLMQTPLGTWLGKRSLMLPII